MVSKAIEKIEVSSAVESVKHFLLNLQNSICQFARDEDKDAVIVEDPWQYNEGGGGITRVLTNGSVFEKAGINFSHVYGQKLPEAATIKRTFLANSPFQALGVSVVMHPMNPYVPTSHFNVRFIVVENEERPFWWFGGGFDLTPYYGFAEDCKHWHRMAKSACDPFGPDLYQKYKKWADQYFFLKHRHEQRGIGGIFYDDLNEWGFDRCFAFMKNVGEHYIQAYQPLVTKHKNILYQQKERDFQLYRRSRYVEFNLLYDRGTLFGIQSGGRCESILMSLPPLVSFRYNFHPDAGSDEMKLYTEFLPVRDWV